MCKGVSIPLITFIGELPLKMKIKLPLPNLCHFRDFRLEVVCLLSFAEKRNEIFRNQNSKAKLNVRVTVSSNLNMKG